MKGFTPHIGKNVIETLTLGMYENAFFIYREYVQNAADQIDIAVEEGILEKKSEGEININVDPIDRIISVEDNATGISTDHVLKFLGDIANSQKDRTKRKGFRGIGRLGGLGYCEQLIFETTYRGEDVKSIITLNAKQLKTIIKDRSITMDAAMVISAITSLSEKEAQLEEHYFKVVLRKVTKEELLNEDEVRDYLSMVAPIPFAEEFPFSKQIHAYFNTNNVKIEEYYIQLNINDEKLYKAYKTDIFSKNGEPISKILGIKHLEIRNEGELIALGWIGISDLLNKVIHSNNIERGIRVRKDNIQIGSEDTLNSYFNEDRFNHHFIGEIHALGPNFVPNARRDFFNEDKTCQVFMEQLREKFRTLYALSHDSSKIHNRFTEIRAYKSAKEKFDEKEFTSSKQEKYHRTELMGIKVKAEKALDTLNKVLSKPDYKAAINIIYNHVVGDFDISIEDKEAKSAKQTYSKPNLTSLSESQKKIVLDIFAIIEEELQVDDAERLKQKIEEQFN